MILLPSKKSSFRNVYIPPSVFKKDTKNENQKSDDTEKIKAKIFTKELEDLIKKVSSKKKGAISPEGKISVIPKNLEWEYGIFKNIYENSEDGTKVSEELFKLFSVNGFDNFILGMYNSLTGIYEPIFFYGILQKTVEGFFIHKQNHILDHVTEDFEVFVTEEIENDPFIFKYIQEEDKSINKSLLIKKFSFNNTSFLLTILLKEENPKKKILSPKIDEIINVLHPILPLLIIQLQKKDIIKKDIYNLSDEINLYFKKRFNDNNQKTIYIHKIEILKYLISYDRDRKKAELVSLFKNLVGENDLIIESTFNQFFIFCAEDFTIDFKRELNIKLGKQDEYKIQIFRYPDEIHNFYLCL